MHSLNNDISRIKAIVFDLDDTLYAQIDYKRSGFKVVSEWVAREFELDRQEVLIILEEILDQYGPSYPYMLNRLAERVNLEDAALPLMIDAFIQHDPDIQCYPGVKEMLTRLRKIYRIGILTDGRHEVQSLKINALGLVPMVDQILCSDAMGLEKPADELFAWFEEKFALPGMNLMYMGDNPQKDFYGATLRGWTTIRVKSGEHCDESPPSAVFGAKYALASVVDLEKFLKQTHISFNCLE
jgi:putative hydrolase of the HAD superfamily